MEKLLNFRETTMSTCMFPDSMCDSRRAPKGALRDGSFMPFGLRNHFNMRRSPLRFSWMQSASRFLLYGVFLGAVHGLLGQTSNSTLIANSIVVNFSDL